MLDHPDLEATRKQVIAQVEEILPQLAENADAAEQNRDLHPESFAALVDSGALRIFAPRRVGGLEAGYRTYLEVTLKLAEACGSAAWLSFILNHGDWQVGHMSQAVQDKVWANGAYEKVGVPLAPAPGWQTQRQDGGTLISGEWPYASGSTYFKWALIGFPLLDDNGLPYDNRLALVSIDDCKIKDSWHVSGMAATGSNTLLIENVYVPDEETITMTQILQHGFLTPYSNEAMYQMDTGCIFHLATFVPVLGLAKTAFNLTLERITGRAKPMTYTYYADTTKSPATQSSMAKAAWMIDTALEQARDTADAIDRQAATGNQFSSIERARYAMRAAQGHRLCRQAMDLLLDVQGAGSFAQTNQMQRVWRDMHMASRHGMSVPGLKEELYGRALLGANEQQMTPII